MSGTVHRKDSSSAPTKCNAKSAATCPYGNSEKYPEAQHYASMEEAQAAYEADMEEAAGSRTLGSAAPKEKEPERFATEAELNKMSEKERREETMRAFEYIKRHQFSSKMDYRDAMDDVVSKDAHHRFAQHISTMGVNNPKLVGQATEDMTVEQYNTFVHTSPMSQEVFEATLEDSKTNGGLPRNITSSRADYFARMSDEKWEETLNRDDVTVQDYNNLGNIARSTPGKERFADRAFEKMNQHLDTDFGNREMPDRLSKFPMQGLHPAEAGAFDRAVNNSTPMEVSAFVSRTKNEDQLKLIRDNGKVHKETRIEAARRLSKGTDTGMVGLHRRLKASTREDYNTTSWKGHQLVSDAQKAAPHLCGDDPYVRGMLDDLERSKSPQRENIINGLHRSTSDVQVAHQLEDMRGPRGVFEHDKKDLAADMSIMANAMSQHGKPNSEG